MKIRKILSGVLACAVMGTALPCADISADETDWKQLYKDKLYDFMSSEDYTKDAAFELCDMSCDGIPELIISEGNSHDDQCRIYTYSPYSDEFLDLGALGYDGTIGYYSAQNAILSRNISEGLEQGTIYHLKNRNNFTKIISYSKSKNTAAGTTVYKINDKQVSSFNYYQLALEDYQIDNFEWLGREYDLNEENIESALPETPEAPVPDWRELYTQQLHSIRRYNENYSRNYMFDLYDMTGDGIPELIVSDGELVTGNCTSVYTISGENVKTLGVFGGYGTLGFSPGNGIIISEYSGYKECYAFDENLIKSVFSSRSSYNSEQKKMTYMVNNEIVDSETYSAANEKYRFKDTIYLGRKYQLGDSAIEYAMNPPELNLTDKQKELYAKELIEISASNDDYNADAFDLCDLNSDGVPEMIITHYGYAVIYTIHDGKLVKSDYYSNRGQLKFDLEQQLFYDSYEHMGTLLGNYNKLTGDTVSTVLSYSQKDEEYSDYRISIGTDDEYYYEINGVEVSQEEYYAALAEYKNLDNGIVIGERYDCNLANIASALYPDSSALMQMKLICFAQEAAACNLTKSYSFSNTPSAI